jgi:transcriptional regulator with XRE-family HTH domain
MRDAHEANDSKKQINQTLKPKLDIAGARLRKIREACGKTLAEVAQAAGVELSFLEAVESGNKDPTLSELRNIAEGLGVPIPQIFSDLTPEAVVVGITYDKVPEDLQDAVKIILNHPWVKA